MFATAKELRKVSSKSQSSKANKAGGKNSSSLPSQSPSSSISGGGSRDHGTGSENQLIEQLKIEREERKLLKEYNQKVILIQKLWRQKSSNRRLNESFRNEFDKKLNDIENVKTILLKSKGIQFIPPMDICYRLYQVIVFLMKFNKMEDGIRLIRYFHSILTISLLEQEEEKNLILPIAQNIHLFFQFFDGIQKTINFYFIKNSLMTLEHMSLLLLGIRYLMGLGAPYRMTYPSKINAAFLSLRSESLNRNCYFDRREMNLFHILAAMIWKQSFAKHFKQRIDDNEESKGGIISSLSDLSRPSVNCLGDQLCLLSFDLCSLDLEMKRERQRIALRELFAVPAFTYMISTSCLQSNIATAEILTILLTLFNNTQLVLPPSPIPAFKSGQWLIGNLTSLCCFLPLDPKASTQMNDNDQREILHDQLLIDYLNLLLTLFIKFDVPGVWQGRRGVIWTREGTTLIAAAVPKPLQYQLLSFCEGGNMKRLYQRCIAPLGNSSALLSPPGATGIMKMSPVVTPVEGQSIYPRKKDYTEVLEALNSSGLKMARDSLLEQKETANSWLGSSKWATKMMKSVSKAFNTSLFGSHEQAPSQNDVTAALKSSRAEPEFEEQEVMSSPFLPNDLLASTLCKIWSLLLPQAANSSPESICWKGLSVLCFSTPRCVNKLWALAVRSSSSFSSSSIFASSEGEPFHLTFPSLPTAGEISMKRDLVPGVSNGLEVVISMTAILKIICIALDDSELYDRGIPLPLPHVLPYLRFLNNLLFRAIEENASFLLSELTAAPHSSVSGGGGASSSDPLQSQSNSEKAFQLSYQINCLK
jgi:hypothetical protein